MIARLDTGDARAAAATGPTSAQPWQAQALWQRLEPWLPGLSVEVLAQAGSTNTLLLERARSAMGREGDAADRQGRGAPGRGRRAGDTQPSLVVAEEQTLGRGRMGRRWHARRGHSLTFSLSLALAPADWQGLSLAVGVALADALEPPEPGRALRLGLKWPNDLWLLDGPERMRSAPSAPGPGRKLGGVLIETVSVGAQRMVVVGVGLNVLPLEGVDDPPEREFGSGCAGLQEIDPTASAPTALHCVALPLVRALHQFEREGFAGFSAAYARRDLLRGRDVEVRDPLSGALLQAGRADGVDGVGALLLRTDHGAEPVRSGDVSVRLGVGRP